MKILLVGVCDNEESTNFHQMKALKNLGHEVEPFNYRTMAQKAHQEGDTELAAGWYRETINEFGPQLVIYCKFNDWPSEAIQWTRDKGILTWLWYVDPMQQLSTGIISHAKTADYASCTGMAQTEYLKALDINCHHIMEGVDPKIYYPAEAVEPIADVAFIGAATQERYEFLSAIEERGVKTAAGGPGWSTTETVDVGRFRELCANCTMVLGRDREIHTHGYFSDRAFRVMAAGGVYVTVQTLGTEKFLINGVNSFTAATEEELVELIVDIVENPDQYNLAEVRRRGRQFVLDNHTWEHSMQQLLAEVEVG